MAARKMFIAWAPRVPWLILVIGSEIGELNASGTIAREWEFPRLSCRLSGWLDRVDRGVGGPAMAS